MPKSPRETNFMITMLAACLLLSCQPPPGTASSSDWYELRDLDLSGWEYREKPEGTAKDSFVRERNRQKNRHWSDPGSPPTWSCAEFVAKTDATTKEIGLPDSGRVLLTDGQIKALEKAEAQIVCLEGYMTLSYPGPKESANGDVKFHDWHLEIVSKPLGRYPQIGDSTAIIAETTPHTERKLYRDGTRLNTLCEWMRAEIRVDGKPHIVPFKSQGGKARRVRITGYLFWDYSHIGPGQVGAKIETGGAPSYHNPWRQTAWEIHPVLKIEDLGG